MNKEELEDLLSIGCCRYHEEIGEKAKKEIERLTELCNKYEEEHKTTFETWKKDIKVLTELEKWLKDGGFYIYVGTLKEYVISKTNLEDKLKELKQGGSNESNRFIK